MTDFLAAFRRPEGKRWVGRRIGLGLRPHIPSESESNEEFPDATTSSLVPSIKSDEIGGDENVSVVEQKSSTNVDDTNISSSINSPVEEDILQLKEHDYSFTIYST